MLSSKQRSFLKSLGNNIKPSYQIGKSGITESLLEDLNSQLENKELIKISVLDNSPINIKESADEIQKFTDCEIVQTIGNKMLIYKESKEHKKIELE